MASSRIDSLDRTLRSTPEERSLGITDPAPARPDGLELSPGMRVAGTYEILGLLGEGGMGQVYEAMDLILDRRVALKFARSSETTRQLRNEARALAAFRHPSLVTVHTLGAHEGRDFLVMERIYGISLIDHLTRRAAMGRPLGLIEAVDMLASISEGLSIVHRAGLVHRDVKLDNVMMTPDGRVVLMDFGLALPEFHVGAQHTIAGSPAYMAPEAITNSVESGLGHLCDVYALGICAFELVTGNKPFVAASLVELMELHESGFVPRIDAHRVEAPERLSVLVASMMAKTPLERPQSAEAIAWQMRSIRDRELHTTARVREAPDDSFDVLVVDDDPDIARVLEFYAKKALGKANVRVARDGVEAMQRLEEREPDVMLLDLHMPRMNGIDVCMQMRSRRIALGTVIISVSAGAQEHDRQLMHQLGIHRFVEKGEKLREGLTAALRDIAGVRA